MIVRQRLQEGTLLVLVLDLHSCASLAELIFAAILWLQINLLLEQSNLLFQAVTELQATSYGVVEISLTY